MKFAISLTCISLLTSLCKVDTERTRRFPQFEKMQIEYEQLKHHGLISNKKQIYFELWFNSHQRKLQSLNFFNLFNSCIAAYTGLTTLSRLAAVGLGFMSRKTQVGRKIAEIPPLFTYHSAPSFSCKSRYTNCDHLGEVEMVMYFCNAVDVQRLIERCLQMFIEFLLPAMNYGQGPMLIQSYNSDDRRVEDVWEQREFVF